MDADIAWEECISDLPLDTQSLPPLNALSSSSDSSLQQLDLLDLLTFDQSAETPDPPHKLDLDPFSPPSDADTAPETLSQCTTNSASDSANSPSPCKPTPPSHTSIAQDDNSPPRPNDHQSDLVLELSTRLASASAEATALRKRVASLSVENRGLRAALDHANARLVAVAQAAASQPPATSPVVLGLAQVSADVASRLAGALTVSDTSDDSPRDRKKRKRVTGAATTMACVMFMWGAMVGTPGMLKSSTSAFRSDGNLPAVWKGDGARAVASASAVAPVNRIPNDDMAWQPNCMRVLKELPDGSKSDDEHESHLNDEDSKPTVKTEEKAMFVDVADEASAKVISHSDAHDPRHPQYSYVLCRDTVAAINNVKACANRVRHGEDCGTPHTISLILPAAAAGLADENDTSSRQPALAEVQCSILSVARIPAQSHPDKSASKYGRIIATVPETGTVIRG